jgi:hypothetical protein
VGFVVDVVALGQVFSEYFDFSSQFSFDELLHTHLSFYHRRCIVSTLTASSNSILGKEDGEFIDQMLSLEQELGYAIRTARGKREV